MRVRQAIDAFESDKTLVVIVVVGESVYCHAFGHCCMDELEGQSAVLHFRDYADMAYLL